MTSSAPENSFPELEPVSYQGKVFRNIFTCSPSQHLLDDVCPDQEEASWVDRLIQMTSGIDHQTPQKERPFQYGALESAEILKVFEKQKWNIGRFGDGKHYGVWYSAEQELTSVYESCWTTYQLGRDNVLMHGEVYSSDRRLFEAKVASDQTIDLMPQASSNPRLYSQLTHETHGDFCQSLGAKIHERGFEILRTPSARHVGGVCTPLFSPRPIQNLSSLYDFSIHIKPDGLISVSSPRFSLLIPVSALGQHQSP